MSSGILLFVILAVTGGLIAYAGDTIGRKVGRKHWTLFSLRPRHTGAIVTAVSGVVMIGAVMGILYGLDGDFQAAVNNEASQWRRQFDTLVGQAGRDKISLARQKVELQRLAAYNSALNTEQARIQAQLQTTRKSLEAQQARLASLKEQERSLRQRIALLNRENQQLRQESLQLQASQHLLNREITRLAWKVNRVKKATLAARAGEVLMNAETAGGQSAEHSQQLVAKALSILGKQVPTRGNVSIPSRDVEAAVQALQLPGHYLIRITASNNAGTNDPLSVRLQVLNHPAPTVDIASDILERDRLQGNGLRERLARKQPPASAEEPTASAPLSPEDRTSLLEVVEQLSRATAPGNVQARMLNDPDLGGPLHLRLDTSNTPE